ncbi:MAG TPA: RNB domain-containing ribonuclease [Pyrinomonadaceae bacterium]|jgi:exoribonuclease-2|nr:RNB domain-containing ribonuclease [Pyrinomonadaceae bacterium]
MKHRPAPDIRAIAREAVLDAGLEPDFPPEAEQEVEADEQKGERAAPDSSIRDMRGLLWSSIDNRESRDLDQIEYAERLAAGGYRVLVGIADVDAFVAKGSAIDRHAAFNTVSVYTPAVIFPMLPEQLSTGLTSLLQDEDRLAVVMELSVTAGGDITSKEVYRAVVRNRAKMDYDSVGAWLEGRGAIPQLVAAVSGLEEQLKLQDEIARSLHELRVQHGALELDMPEAVPVVTDDKVVGINVRQHNRAQDIIESLMIAANTSMAEYLEERGVPSLRRVVRAPERWPLIVKTAEGFGEHLPDTPDPRALAEFMARRRAADPAAYPELSLSILKMLGPGDYMVEAPGLQQEGHFGLAVHDYTHSTAPNRRYPDLVTQRCLKSAAISATPAPYTREELEAIAERCNKMESAARKVERRLRKVAAAVLLSDRVGETFDAVVTGVTDRGTFARLLAPPADGRIVRGEESLDVGEHLRVRLLSTDPERGFLDFARAGH